MLYRWSMTQACAVMVDCSKQWWIADGPRIDVNLRIERIGNGEHTGRRDIRTHHTTVGFVPCRRRVRQHLPRSFGTKRLRIVGNAGEIRLPSCELHLERWLLGAHHLDLRPLRPLACCLQRLLAVAALVALSVVPLFWCPWSVTWLSQKAYDAHAAEQYDVAFDRYTEIIRIDPSNSWAYLNRSYVHQALGQAGQAQADLQKARDLDPSIEASE